MTFIEKLKMLTDPLIKTKLSDRAGLHRTAVSSYLRGHKPSADGALRLARALGVSVDWLLDDAQGMPPVRVNQTNAA